MPQPPAGPPSVPDSETALIQPTPRRRPRRHRGPGVQPAHSLLAFVVAAVAALGVVVATGVAPVTSLAAMAGVARLPAGSSVAGVPDAPVQPVLGPAPETGDTVGDASDPTATTTGRVAVRSTTVPPRPVVPARPPVVAPVPPQQVPPKQDPPVQDPPQDPPTQAPTEPTKPTRPTEPTKPTDPPSSDPAPTKPNDPAAPGGR